MLVFASGEYISFDRVIAEQAAVEEPLQPHVIADAFGESG